MTINCPITGLSIPRLLLATLAGFAFIFGYEYLVHEILLQDQYIATQDLWRTPEDIQEIFHIAVISMALSSLVLAILYGVFVPCRSVKKSLGFGALIGTLMGLCGASAYVYMPLPQSLALSWFGIALIEGIGLALIYKCTFGCKNCGKEKT